MKSRSSNTQAPACLAGASLESNMRKLAVIGTIIGANSAAVVSTLVFGAMPTMIVLGAIAGACLAHVQEERKAAKIQADLFKDDAPF